MTTFKEQMLADLDCFFNLDEMAETVTYNPGTGPAEIPALVDYEEPGGQNASAGAQITVKKSDVAAPGYRHTFAIDGVVWHVAMENSRPKIQGDAHIWIIDLVQDERSKAWRT